jgi:hypothetical protein
MAILPRATSLREAKLVIASFGTVTDIEYHDRQDPRQDAHVAYKVTYKHPESALLTVEQEYDGVTFHTDATHTAAKKTALIATYLNPPTNGTTEEDRRTDATARASTLYGAIEQLKTYLAELTPLTPEQQAQGTRARLEDSEAERSEKRSKSQ